jgi:hypothetical protein
MSFIYFFLKEMDEKSFAPLNEKKGACRPELFLLKARKARLFSAPFRFFRYRFFKKY